MKLWIPLISTRAARALRGQATGQKPLDKESSWLKEFELDRLDSMLGNELNQVPPGTRDLRKFGLIVGCGFLLLGVWGLVRHRPAGPYLAGVGAALFLLGAFAPRALRCLHFAWMMLALFVGLFMSGLLLTLIYLLVITPVSLAARLLGKDFPSLRRDSRASSHWRKRDPSASR